MKTPILVMPILVALGFAVSVHTTSAKDAVTLPPEITPKLRVVCESDVRRLCITAAATMQNVHRCVIKKFDQLNPDCRREIRNAGLAP